MRGRLTGETSSISDMGARHAGVAPEASTAARRCRAPGCDGACAAGDFYCTRDTNALFAALTDTIEVVRKSAREFYVGRTHYPEQRLLAHCRDRGLDHLAVIHWAGDREEIAMLEQRLIGDAKAPTTTGQARQKCANESDDSEGRWASYWNCIYIVWCWKNGMACWPGFVEVTSLDRGRRLCPDRTALVKRPDYLFTRLTPDEARLAIRFPRRKTADGHDLPMPHNASASASDTTPSGSSDEFEP